MADSIGKRLQRAWRVFSGQNLESSKDYGPSVHGSYGVRGGSTYLSLATEKAFINSIYTQISIDFSQLDIRHVKVDEEGRYLEDKNTSSLQNCFQVEANIDQTNVAFKQDIALSLIEHGVIAIVPVDTVGDPFVSDQFDIRTIRVGKIMDWRPRHVLINLYDDQVGMMKEIWVPKRACAIVESPLYPVINAPNSTMQRLLAKLALLDKSDAHTASGKLDIIIQMPYTVRSETRKTEAQKRVESIQMQLRANDYGIAYADATERITQLNRPAENKLPEQIMALKQELFNQLGMSTSVFDGTASDEVLLNYHNRTIKPMMDAVVSSMHRTFLSRKARGQGEAVRFFRDPFKFVSVKELAEIADKFTRNEIYSPNEVRAILGVRPSKDPKADELRNRNIAAPVEEAPAEESSEGWPENFSPPNLEAVG